MSGGAVVDLWVRNTSRYSVPRSSAAEGGEAEDGEAEEGEVEEGEEEGPASAVTSGGLLEVSKYEVLTS